MQALKLYLFCVAATNGGNANCFTRSAMLEEAISAEIVSAASLI